MMTTEEPSSCHFPLDTTSRLRAMPLAAPVDISRGLPPARCWEFVEDSTLSRFSTALAAGRLLIPRCRVRAPGGLQLLVDTSGRHPRNPPWSLRYSSALPADIRGSTHGRFAQLHSPQALGQGDVVSPLVGDSVSERSERPLALCDAFEFRWGLAGQLSIADHEAFETCEVCEF